ncbi:LmbE family N-acetylglucosaminyl deacetylase [Rhodococcus sp. PvR044]|jgi:LmbE family N-acetylglucosaminyl deacetylase|uniref:PIG-L deacetylase family protein n=1 Tax=unclassified Rhodococcus (in: high G+C Gram-positive bacteria) TaxID=192944 RepID=UPI000BC5A5E4|nr:MULTISPECIES: PIG-L family deacetylase [unclassified Rhodococcus (in: high G+C Gram-positive bacteria)]PTR42814.1 GlcNAc-PI de-N-acetylase [Rhodococcus sp. OK611]SNX91829.1 GlcNAc-PI de-N-acetylase [Rhodococcus sp. OK270]
MIDLHALNIAEIAVLGAHCDDIAIGVGGTLLTLTNAMPDLRVRAFVMSGTDSRREIEERHALAALCPRADLELTVLDIPDGHAPGYWDPIKTALEAFARDVSPDVVFAPQRGDAHQDHRLLAELVPTVFRDHLVLGYEILKWEADTPQPTAFHPLTTRVAEEKARVLMKHYPSQTTHDWFDEQSFLGMSRLRGIQSHRPHAEAFVVEKSTLRFGRK